MRYCIRDSEVRDDFIGPNPSRNSERLYRSFNWSLIETSWWVNYLTYFYCNRKDEKILNKWPFLFTNLFDGCLIFITVYISS
jgi:hypothetical protein